MDGHRASRYRQALQNTGRVGGHVLSYVRTNTSYVFLFFAAQYQAESASHRSNWPMLDQMTPFSSSKSSSVLPNRASM